MAARTKKRAYTCKRCNEKMAGPSSHRSGCPTFADDESALDLDQMGDLVDAALDAVKNEMKANRNKIKKVVKYLRAALDVLEEE